MEILKISQKYKNNFIFSCYKTRPWAPSPLGHSSFLAQLLFSKLYVRTHRTKNSQEKMPRDPRIAKLPTPTIQLFLENFPEISCPKKS